MKRKEIIKRLQVFWDFDTNTNRVVLEGEYLIEVLNLLKMVYPELDEEILKKQIKETNNNIQTRFFMTYLIDILNEEEMDSYFALREIYEEGHLDLERTIIFEEMTKVMHEYLNHPNEINKINCQNKLASLFNEINEWKRN